MIETLIKENEQIKQKMVEVEERSAKKILEMEEQMSKFQSASTFIIPPQVSHEITSPKTSDLEEIQNDMIENNTSEEEGVAQQILLEDSVPIEGRVMTHGRGLDDPTPIITDFDDSSVNLSDGLRVPTDLDIPPEYSSREELELIERFVERRCETPEPEPINPELRSRVKKIFQD
jgi:hypothetical protein